MKHRWIECGLVALLLAVIPLMSLTAADRHCPTFDEPLHMTAGYAMWVRGDHRMTDPGFLPQSWMAMPLQAMHVAFPPKDFQAWRWPLTAHVAYRVFWRLDNNVEAMCRAGRAMIAVLAVVLAVLVWTWSRKLFGPVGGIVSLTLYAFSPTMLAHGALMTADAALALALTAGTWLAWRLTERVTVTRLLLSALVAGAAVLTKAAGSSSFPSPYSWHWSASSRTGRCPWRSADGDGASLREADGPRRSPRLPWCTSPWGSC